MNTDDMGAGNGGRPAAQRPAPLWRGALFGLLCSAAILALSWHAGLLRFDWLAEVWSRRRGLLWGMLLLQSLMAAVNVVRYLVILRACGVRAPWRDVAAATLVSTGLSLWLPASAGVAELLRVGLMCGAEATDREGLPERVVLASLLDRVLGMIAVGLLGVVAAAALLRNPWPRAAQSGALWLTIVLGLLGAALLSAALLALRRWARRVPGVSRADRSLPGWAPRRLRRAGARLWRAVAALRSQSVRTADLALPLLLAWLAFMLLAWILLLAIQAVGGAAMPAAVASALPYFTLAGMLPVSVGGLGGQQLVIVAMLSLLGSEPVAVAAAGVLNASVVLGLHTLLAGIFAGISLGQVRRLQSVGGRGAKDELDDALSSHPLSPTEYATPAVQHGRGVRQLLK